MATSHSGSRACAVTAQTALGTPYFLTELEAPAVAATVRPGQFVMLRAPGIGDPLLGRPFSVFAVTGPGHQPTRIQVLYNVVGRATALFAATLPGQSLQVLGPLGRGFDLQHPPARAVMVAGGIGIAAFRLLAAELQGLGVPTRLLFGARTAQDLVTRDEFARLGVDVVTATDDGSEGHHGLVTDLLARDLQADAAGAMVYACGPTAMLRAVREATIAGGVPAELALEARMGCGFGVCLGCVVASAHEPGTYRLVCRDGPCMPAAEILP